MSVWDFADKHPGWMFFCLFLLVLIVPSIKITWRRT
jgi:hypothetical protein